MTITAKMAGALAITALLAGGIGLGAGAAGASSAGGGCLWAGAPYAQGTTITAGGANFRCGTERGIASWSQTGPSNQAVAVANPGATTAPAGRFSPGARQPGTQYTDYCVGNQLIEGREDIYQVVAYRDGSKGWHAVAPISQWQFGPGDHRPGPSPRSVSMCIDGNLT